MILKLSYLGSITLYVIVFLFSAYASKIKINKIVKIAIISFLPFLIAGYRYNVGWDYGSYARGFDLYDTSVSFFEMLKEYKIGDSVGLNLVLLITKSLNSKFLFFAITSALSFVPAVLYLIDEWDDEKKILPLTIFVTGFSWIRHLCHAVGSCFLTVFPPESCRIPGHLTSGQWPLRQIQLSYTEYLPLHKGHFLFDQIRLSVIPEP